MHFHLPKPLHGWREFAGEVGIIVLGVLIALGAESVVERTHQRAELHEAEDAMVAELRDDNLPQAYTRAAIYNCYADQLDRIEQALASGDRARFVALAPTYRPVVRTWDDEAWKAALASQVLVQSGSKRMVGWSTAYVMIPVLSESANAEQDELPELWAKPAGQAPLTLEQQDRLLRVVSRLRRDNRSMTGASLVLLRFASDVGMRLTEAQKATLLADAKKTFGSCVREPSPDQLNLKSQVAVSSDNALGRR
jgi:hypothetical protein